MTAFLLSQSVPLIVFVCLVLCCFRPAKCLLKQWMRLTGVVGYLVYQWIQAVTARGVSPEANHTLPAKVNWWSLLSDGFESVAYKDALIDRGLNLVGRPWRVLRKGDLRIPVFFMRHGSKLRKQHTARIAAYCHLLQTCEGATSPYGIVIHCDHSGTTIPVTTREHAIFRTALRSAQDVLAASQSGTVPLVDLRAKCWECPLGKPVVHRRGRTESRHHGVMLPVWGAIAEDGRVYHSPCGDRFCWTPPHRRAAEQRIPSIDRRS